MYREGSEARDLFQESWNERALGRETAPRFEVVEGAGLDARAREGVTPRFLQGFRLVLVAVACVFALSLVRVGLSVATVTVLTDNAALKTQVSEAEDAAKALRMEASLLSNSSRVTTIATQNYGMVYAGAGEPLSVTVRADS